MFENCSLIPSLPDLSKWKIEQAKHMKCMFKNCSSLLNIFDFSKWNIDQETEIDDIFEGTILLKYPSTLKFKDNNIINYFISFLNLSENFYPILRRIIEFFCLMFSVPGILYLLYLLLYYYISFYKSYSFNSIKKILNNPIEYFELKQEQQEFYRKKFSKIANETKIEEMMNNIIKRKLNFTHINENIEFEYSIDLFKIYSILLIILNWGKIFVLSFTYINISLKHKYLNRIKSIYIIIVSLLSNIASFVIEILKNNNIKKLLKSIEIYYHEAGEFFRQKLPINIENELELLKSSSTSIVVSIMYSLFFTFLIIIIGLSDI